MTRLWRWLVRILPPRWREEMPGYGYLAIFVHQYVHTAPDQRIPFLQYAFADGAPYARMLLRAGGARPAFRLVLGADLPTDAALLFAHENLPEPTVEDVAVSMLQLAQFAGLPLTTVRQLDDN